MKIISVALILSGVVIALDYRNEEIEQGKYSEKELEDICVGFGGYFIRMACYEFSGVT